MVAWSVHREIASTSGDVGSNPAEIVPEFPNVDFSALGDNWWLEEGTPKTPKHWNRETPDCVERRLTHFKQQILALPADKEHIFCVGHSQFFKALTKMPKMKNVGLMVVDINEDLTVTMVHNYGGESSDGSSIGSVLSHKSDASKGSKPSKASSSTSSKIRPEPEAELLT